MPADPTLPSGSCDEAVARPNEAQQALQRLLADWLLFSQVGLATVAQQLQADAGKHAVIKVCLNAFGYLQ